MIILHVHVEGSVWFMLNMNANYSVLSKSAPINTIRMVDTDWFMPSCGWFGVGVQNRISLETHLKLKSREISFVHNNRFVLSNRFKILHRARQCHCRALYKFSKRSGHCVISYGQTRLREIWVYEKRFGRVSHISQGPRNANYNCPHPGRVE